MSILGNYWPMFNRTEGLWQSSWWIIYFWCLISWLFLRTLHRIWLSNSTSRSTALW